MEYARLNEDGSFREQIKTSGNIEWDATHFCPAAALTPEERAMFRVVEFMDAPKPAYIRETQTCTRDGGVCIDGQWQTKWVIADMTAEQLAAKLAEKRAGMVVSRAKALIALHLAGLLDDIEAYMASPQCDRITKIAWDNALEFSRTSQTVAALAAILGMNDTQLDALFDAAAQVVI